MQNVDIKLNRIYNADCLEILKQIPDKFIDLVVTDPPYLINYKTNHRKDKEHEFCRPIIGDDDEDLIKKYIAECFRILKDNTAMYMFCNSNRVDFFKQELEKFFNVKNIIIWVKNNWTAGDLKAQFGKQYEMIFLVNKGRKEINGKRLTDIWHFDRISGKKQIHPNQKPMELIEQCILKHSNENDIVFDGFSGAGTTPIVALKNNRQFIAAEIDKMYYVKSLLRFKEIFKNEINKQQQ